MINATMNGGVLIMAIPVKCNAYCAIASAGTKKIPAHDSRIA